MEIVTSIIAGAFAMLAAYLAWRLRASEIQIALQNEKRKDKEEFYKKIHRTFDNGMQAIIRHERTAFQSTFIELNTEVTLLSSKELNLLYEQSCQLLESWSLLFIKAWPNTNIIQAPDPAAKHKEPESAEYIKLLEKIAELNEYMRNDLSKNT